MSSNFIIVNTGEGDKILNKDHIALVEPLKEGAKITLSIYANNTPKVIETRQSFDWIAKKLDPTSRP
jgi:hypothetical protein